MIGQTVSHYKITGELGGGGMGVVYKALDTKLDRTVALKFLPPELTRDPEAKARFVREAKTASALQHNNICAIHAIDESDDGRLFICMDYYEGETLQQRIARGPLPLDEAVAIAIQIADGLSKAHEIGMMHRDIKSANIIITSDGVVKIVDFGLAKLAGQTQVTKEGTTLGTVAYMSPEQASGREVDHRSDIFSLGVVLYEMLTGELPFKADHETAVVYRIVHDEPEPLARYLNAVPEGLQRILDTALAKDPGTRHQSAADLAADLRQYRAGAPGPPPVPRRRWLRPIAFGLVGILIVIAGYVGFSHRLPAGPAADSPVSVAVLPFVNLSPDPDDEYLGDGITEDLIHSLARVDRLRVVSRTSAFQFKGKTEDIRDIGKKLGVGAVLEGTVRKSGDELVITTNLIDVDDGLDMWSERFERTMSDVFTIQNEISSAIVEKIRPTLVGGKTNGGVDQHPENIEAYTLYLKGRYQWNIRTPAALEKAKQFFQEAIETDQNYALAYSGLADTYLMMANYSDVPTGDVYVNAKLAAQKAIEINDDLADAHATYALLTWSFDWDWKTADAEFARAVELKGASATAHHWRALFMAFMGRPDDALAEIREALLEDPVSLIINAAVGLVRYYAKDYDESIEQCRKTLEMNPQFSPAMTTMARSYVATGDYDQAISWLKRSIELSGRRPNTLAYLGHAYALAGNEVEARKLLAELASDEYKGKSGPYDRALINVGLGDTRAAVDCLQGMKDYRGFDILSIQADPALETLRETREYAATMKAAGYPIP